MPATAPVAATDLRYVRVSFRGFDGLAHTGELLANARAANALVTVFGDLFAEGYPIERMRVTSAAELNAPPTGDGNTTAAFACRPVRGQKAWSQHAYGLAVDVNRSRIRTTRATLCFPSWPPPTSSAATCGPA